MKKNTPMILFLITASVFLINTNVSGNSDLINEGEVDEYSLPSTFSLTRQGSKFALVLKHPEPITIFSSFYVYFIMETINAQVKLNIMNPLEAGRPPHDWVEKPIDNRNWKFYRSMELEHFGPGSDDEIERLNEKNYKILLNAISSYDILFFDIITYTNPAYLRFSFFSRDDFGNPAKILSINVNGENITSGIKIPLTYPTKNIPKQNNYIIPPPPSQGLTIVTVSVGLGVGIGVPTVSPLLKMLVRQSPAMTKEAVSHETPDLIKKSIKIN